MVYEVHRVFNSRGYWSSAQARTHRKNVCIIRDSYSSQAFKKRLKIAIFSKGVSQMTLEIFLLGQVSIKEEGAPVTGFTTRKELALFVYLAHTGRAYSREELAEMLWSDRPAGQALANLRTVLTNLRRRLG